MVSHALICGTNKSGTTSLFRYLADHPEIIPCSRKEAGFFFRPLSNDLGNTYKEYCDLFPSAHDDKILIEATPTYLDRGAEVAQRIKQLLPDARLVFVLREPVARLVSYFRSKHGMETSPVANVSFDEFIHRAIEESGQEETGTIDRNGYGWQLIKAQYGRFLLEYLDYFKPDDIHVTFFDYLASDAAVVTKEVCDFLGIDGAIYDSYEFSVENKSRVHRSSTLRTVASKTNAFAEPVLNRMPALRRLMRYGYNAINVDNGEKAETVDPELIGRLREYYVPHNRETREVLTQRLNCQKLPAWLASA
jgi:hypothetical protein